MKIFITGTFRNEWNKKFNPKLASVLEANGFEIYLPQRDTEQKENEKNTFEQNVEGVSKSDVLLAVGKNMQTANWGFEIGYAYAKDIPVVILVEKDDEVHLMTAEAAKKVFSPANLDEIDEYIDELMSFIKEL